MSTAPTITISTLKVADAQTLDAISRATMTAVTPVGRDAEGVIALVRASEAVQPPRRNADFSDVELREDGDKIQFTGHAAVFTRLSEDLGGFRERIQPGAFKKVLDANADVRFLFNHDPNHVMARTKSGTMELREDPKGLRVYAELAPTTIAKDLRVLVKRGDVDGMSFAFSVDKDVWAEEDGVLTRTIVSFRDLFDVGPVVYPAYPQTDASMRAIVLGAQLVEEPPAKPPAGYFNRFRFKLRALDQIRS